MNNINVNKIEEFLGKTLREVIVHEDNDHIIFHFTNGEMYEMMHDQECCESVYIESITGDLGDLIGNPLLMAEYVTKDIQMGKNMNDLEEWTFYKFATINGYVDIRWYGGSNGYYSVDVSIDRI